MHNQYNLDALDQGSCLKVGVNVEKPLTLPLSGPCGEGTEDQHYQHARDSSKTALRGDSPGSTPALMDSFLSGKTSSRASLT